MERILQEVTELKQRVTQLETRLVAEQHKVANLETSLAVEQQRPKILDSGEYGIWERHGEVHNTPLIVAKIPIPQHVLPLLINPVIHVSVVGHASHWVVNGTNSVYYITGENIFRVFLHSSKEGILNTADALLDAAKSYKWRVQYVIFNKQ